MARFARSYFVAFIKLHTLPSHYVIWREKIVAVARKEDLFATNQVVIAFPKLVGANKIYRCAYFRSYNVN